MKMRQGKGIPIITEKRSHRKMRPRPHPSQPKSKPYLKARISAKNITTRSKENYSNKEC